MTYFGSMNPKPILDDGKTVPKNYGIQSDMKAMQAYVDNTTAKAQDLIAQYMALRSTFADDIRYYSGKK